MPSLFHRPWSTEGGGGGHDAADKDATAVAGGGEYGDVSSHVPPSYAGAMALPADQT